MTMDCKNFDHAKARIICGDCISEIYITHGGHPCIDRGIACPRVPCPNHKNHYAKNSDAVDG